MTAFTMSLLRGSFVAAVRRIKKHVALTFINVICLSFGIAAFLIITLYVINEYSFNRNYTNFDRLARITTTFKSVQTGQVDALAYALPDLTIRMRDHSEVESTLGILYSSDRLTVKIGDRVYLEDAILKTQSGYFGFFDHVMVSGDSSVALDEANSIVLTRSLATKYFGNEDAVGKTLTLENEEHIVTAVIEDLPSNVDLHFDALVSLPSQHISSFSDWAHVYLKLVPHADVAAVQKFADNVYASEYHETMLESQLEGKFAVERLADIHFGPAYQGDPVKGNKFQLLALEAVGIIILIISMINYINFTISQASKRNPEIGIRKVFGASARGIVMQCAAESFLFIVCGMLFAGLIYYLLEPQMHQVIGYTLSLENVSLTYFTIILVLAFPLLTLMAGIYQAIFFSNINPIHAVRAKQDPGSSRTLFSLPNSLLFIQLCACISLVIGSLIISQQVDLLTTTVPSFNKDQVMVLDIPMEADEQQTIDLANQLAQFSEAVYVTGVGRNSLPTSSPKHFDTYSVNNGVGDQTKICSSVQVGQHYLELLQIQLVLGRDFNERDFASDSSLNVIVNESFVNSFSLSNPIDKTFRYGQSEYRIIGVVKDFNDNGLQKRVEALILFPMDDRPVSLLFKASGFNPALMSKIQGVWEDVFGSIQLDYRFLDDEFMNQFTRETTLQKLTSYFSTLALVIAFCGLFSMTMLDLKRKVRPFTLRKIFGASVWDITWAAGKIYVYIFALAMVVAIPILIFWMRDWLSNFKYKASLGLHLIIPSLLFIGLTVLLIVGFQVFLVNRKNSLEGLRSD